MVDNIVRSRNLLVLDNRPVISEHSFPGSILKLGFLGRGEGGRGWGTYINNSINFQTLFPEKVNETQFAVIVNKHLSHFPKAESDVYPHE